MKFFCKEHTEKRIQYVLDVFTFSVKLSFVVPDNAVFSLVIKGVDGVCTFDAEYNDATGLVESTVSLEECTVSGDYTILLQMQVNGDTAGSVLWRGIVYKQPLFIYPAVENSEVYLTPCEKLLTYFDEYFRSPQTISDMITLSKSIGDMSISTDPKMIMELYLKVKAQASFERAALDGKSLHKCYVY